MYLARPLDAIQLMNRQPRARKTASPAEPGRTDADVRRTYILAIRKCPNCNQEVFAAESASSVPKGMRLEWHCDLCGHHFSTTEPNDAMAA
jgi:hypothetical protein